MSAADIMTRIAARLPGTLGLLIPAHAARGCRARPGNLGADTQAISEDVRRMNRRALYPARRRPDVQGWLDAEWKVSPLGGRANYYPLTTSGRRQLAVDTREWERRSDAIARVMRFRKP